MSILAVFLIIAVISATYSLLKEERLLNVMNLLVVFGLCLLIFKVHLSSTIGIAIVVFTILGFVFYISRYTPYSKLGNAAIVICATSSALGPLFRIMHWPGGNLWVMIGFVGVVFGMLWYFKDASKDDKNLSPFILLIPYCLVNFIQFLQY